MLRWRRAGKGCAKTAAVGADVAHLGRPLGSVCMCAFLFCADKRVAHTTVVDARPPCAPPVPNVKAVYHAGQELAFLFIALGCLFCVVEFCNCFDEASGRGSENKRTDRRRWYSTELYRHVNNPVYEGFFYLYHTFACTFYFCCSTFVRMCTRLYSLAYQSNIISVLL